MKASATAWLVALGCLAMVPQSASSQTTTHYSPTPRSANIPGGKLIPCYVRFIDSEKTSDAPQPQAERSPSGSPGSDFAEQLGLCAPYAQGATERYHFQALSPAEEAPAAVASPGPPDPIDFTPWIQMAIHPMRTLRQADELLKSNDIVGIYADTRTSVVASRQFAAHWAGVLHEVWTSSATFPAAVGDEYFVEHIEPQDDAEQAITAAEANRQLVLGMAHTLDQVGSVLQQWSRQLSQWAENEKLAAAVPAGNPLRKAR